MEVRKIKSHERVTEERDHGDDDIIHTVLFTAGVALLMACLKRAMITCLVEQWRAWVFLILNLVLLAILFTSLRSGSNENQECDDHVQMKIERKKNRRRCTWPAPAEEHEDHCHKVYEKKSGGNEPERVDHDQDHAEIPIRLSKEELNTRVETFIATFRQHLVSDAKKGRSQFFMKPERAKILNFQKVSYITLSPQGSGP